MPHNHQLSVVYKTERKNPAVYKTERKNSAVYKTERENPVLYKTERENYGRGGLTLVRTDSSAVFLQLVFPFIFASIKGGKKEG